MEMEIEGSMWVFKFATGCWGVVASSKEVTAGLATKLQGLYNTLSYPRKYVYVPVRAPQY
jgi:hypothetical protein